MGHLLSKQEAFRDNHEAKGLRYFLVPCIEVKQNPFKEPQSTVHALFNNLCLSHGLKYVNLSGQSISSLSFLQGTR